MATYQLKVDAGALRVLLGMASGPLIHPRIGPAVGQAVRKWGVLVQTRAVYNVTGHPVVYNGNYFVVRVRTGTLRGAIELQWPYQSALQARVFVNGTAVNPGEVPGVAGKPRPVSDYAMAIEKGHKEIDLKKTMRGKTVPFFGVKAQKANGPYAARGLKPTTEGDTGYGSHWRSAELDAKLAAKSKGPMVFTKKGGSAAYTGAAKGATTYFISFRRVGAHGWVIPMARPRPFMGAALTSTADAGRRMVVRDVAAAIQDAWAAQ